MDDAWVMSTADLTGLGLGATEIARLVKSGHLVRLRRGIYRRARDSDHQDVRSWPLGELEMRHRFLLHATLSTLSAGSVFSHVSAATLHGLPVPARLLDRATSIRDGSGSGSKTRTAHRRYARLPPADITEVDGLPVTSLVRTAVDLGRTLSFVDAVAVIDAALARGVEREQLLSVLEQRSPHNARARAAVDFGDPRAESPGESRCRATMKLAGIPIPTLQFRVLDDRGVEVARTDFGWEEWGLVGEFDGLVKYGRLLKPGQDVQDVISSEKRREENVRRCNWWITRWVESDLWNIDQFRAGALRALRAAKHPRAA